MRTTASTFADLDRLVTDASYVLPSREEEIGWREMLREFACTSQPTKAALRAALVEVVAENTGCTLMDDEADGFLEGMTLRELLARRVHVFSDVKRPWHQQHVSLAPVSLIEPESEPKDEPDFEPQVRSITPVSPLRTICFRCHQPIIPKIVRENQVTGAIGLPVAGRMVIAPVQGTRYHLECPQCGVPLPDDEEVTRLNGGTSDGILTVGLVILCLIIVFGGGLVIAILASH